MNLFIYNIKNIDRIRKAYKTQLANAIVKITNLAEVDKHVSKNTVIVCNLDTPS